MANESTTQVKTYFERGDKPTEGNYIALIDTLSQVLYEPTRAYMPGEPVIIDNSGYKTYLCITETVAGESPITTPLKWEESGGGGGGSQNLQQVLDTGSTGSIPGSIDMSTTGVNEAVRLLKFTASVYAGFFAGNGGDVRDVAMGRSTDNTMLNNFAGFKYDSTANQNFNQIFNDIIKFGGQHLIFETTGNSGLSIGFNVNNFDVIDNRTVKKGLGDNADYSAEKTDFSYVTKIMAAVQDMTNAFKFGGQATGGHEVKTFSAITSFDCNDGNSQEMILTGNITSLSLTNEVAGGSYLFYLVQNGTGGYTIPVPDASFGNKTDNSVVDFVTVANGVNIINFNVRPNGSKYWTLETYTP